ncbi:MAG: tRNA (cytidine(56)-2'-O)-methyltransferase [Euryarchaeota archaeon]|nr:tRNA (cytidine(56)-2'-O)-methyltransferase [Euryarchaeota archaeon]
MEIVVLRLGHRIDRDKRTTTHVGLCARALGAQGMLLVGSDDSVVAAIRDVVERWGGDFWIKNRVNWKQEIFKWKEKGGKVLHLTMYGANLPSVIDTIDADKLMVAVGAEKVPPELYTLADYNVAITHQPHSEIAALSIFLDRLQEGRELSTDFEGKTRINGDVQRKGSKRDEKVS